MQLRDNCSGLVFGALISKPQATLRLSQFEYNSHISHLTLQVLSRTRIVDARRNKLKFINESFLLKGERDGVA